MATAASSFASPTAALKHEIRVRALHQLSSEAPSSFDTFATGEFAAERNKLEVEEAEAILHLHESGLHHRRLLASGHENS
eukprot:396221-Heterocapsa_arctica.AAC.1